MADKTIRVLIVDDDEDDYILTRKLLEEINGTRYELDWISDIDSGIASFNAEAYDVILLDYYIGGRTGIEILREAAADGCTTPIILLTGLGDRDIDFAAMEAGAADYLEKNSLTVHLLERSLRYAISAALARKSLLEKSLLLQTTLDNTSSGIAAFDQSNKLIAWNDRFLRMLGLEKGFEYLDNAKLSLGGLGYKDLKRNHPEVAESFDEYSLLVMRVVAKRFSNIKIFPVSIVVVCCFP